MKNYENLLVTVAEESAEVAKAASKALRFGLDGDVPGDPKTTNADEIVTEFLHLSAMVEMLQEDGRLPKWEDDKVRMIKREKVLKVLSYQDTSRRIGTLEADERSL